LQRGFSLIELIVVVTIVGILASIALVNVRTAQRKAREAALRDNLFNMRKAIDNFYADKQRYPADLNELVPNYIRRIPKDPITMQDDWETVMDDPMSLDGEMSADTDPNAVTQPGVIDIKSRAQGTTLDNVPYPDL
jgi:general secretion pathway protein G